MAKRIALSLDKDQLALIRSVKGFGNKDAEIVKNIMLAYLSEKGYVEEFNKKNASKDNSGAKSGSKSAKRVEKDA